MWRRALLAALVATLALAGSAQAEPVTVMTFNVWYGGVQVDFPSIGRAIRAADADIVGVQEPEGGLRRIARSAGLPYYDPTLHVISRYPLFARNVGGEFMSPVRKTGTPRRARPASGRR